MNKKITLNIALLLVTYAAPLYIFRRYQDDYKNIEIRQYSVFVLLFIGATLLTYLNIKYKKNSLKNKWPWVIFMIIGIIGLCYSGFVLFLLFSLRNCCSL